MLQLNLPNYHFRIKEDEKGFLILDNFRKKFVRLTPEEWVRQHFLLYLIEEKGFPKGLLAVEKQLSINGMKKRCDAIFYSQKGNPLIVIEFKAPNVPINQAVFDQLAVYNSKLKVDYFIVSNGLEHYFCRVNTQNSTYEFSEEMPNYTEFTRFQSIQ